MEEQQTLEEVFSPEIHQTVDGLMWLGHLEEEVSFCGHTFVLRTLKASEELQVALLAKDYIDTYGQVKANVWANLAAALIAVDGEEDFCPPIGPDRTSRVRSKFQYITSNWYWPVAEYLFGHFSELNLRQAEAIRAVEDLSSRSLRTSWPSQDSSTGQTDTEEASTDSNSDSSPTS